MSDLVLRLLLEGKLQNKPHPPAENNKETAAEKVMQHQIEAYLTAFSYSDEDKFNPPARQRARLKEELSAKAHLSELSEYIAAAFAILSQEWVKSAQTDFAHAKDLLARGTLLIEAKNLKTVLCLSDATMTAIYALATEKFNAGDHVSGLPLFVLLLVLQPESTHYWCCAAIAAHALNNYELAARLCRAIVKLDVDCSTGWIFLIDCYLQLDQLQDAKAAYASAMERLLPLEEDEILRQAFNQVKFCIEST